MAESRRDAGGRAAAAEPEEPMARATHRRRRRRDAALALPVLGAFLLASPFLDLFADGPRPFGVPLGAAYVFVVWFALIALSAWLARRLIEDQETG